MPSLKLKCCFQTVVTAALYAYSSLYCMKSACEENLSVSCCYPMLPSVQTKDCHMRFTDRYLQERKVEKNQCCQPCQHVLGFMGCLSKPKTEKVANLGCSGWSWIKKELRYRSGGGGWPEQEEEEGQWEVTEGERSHQSRQHCWFSLFKVTALTDTTRPGGCLQDQMLLPLRGSKWQFCMALDKMHHTAGENLQG